MSNFIVDTFFSFFDTLNKDYLKRILKTMKNNAKNFENRNNRRTFGAHLTSTEIFHKWVYPEIKEKLFNYIWVDLYAGEGNLILPILDFIPLENRIKFFEEHIFLFDIQPEMIQESIKNALGYEIPLEIARKNILLRNNLENFPEFLKKRRLPLYHITNPPYLYLGYIRKHKETQDYLKYFEKDNEGYQDLYQIAMIKDLRHNVENLIYIIPSNFLFGDSVSNKFRLDFLKFYNILKMIIYETKIFEYTGTNICIGFFKRKNIPKNEIVEFNGLKIKQSNKTLKKGYTLKPKYKYRAGSKFLEFLENNKANQPLVVNYYLLNAEVVKNKGSNQITVIDSNNYNNNEYKLKTLYVNDHLKRKIDSNILYVQTVDKGSSKGRVGLRYIRNDFNVSGIYVSSNTYRTHPIQIFLEPKISINDQILLKDYFNFLLEHFRRELDSEFLTTYKYSSAKYTRKYLGLTQVRRLIETFPIIGLDESSKSYLKLAIENNLFENILKILKKKD